MHEAPDGMPPTLCTPARARNGTCRHTRTEVRVKDMTKRPDAPEYPSANHAVGRVRRGRSHGNAPGGGGGREGALTDSDVVEGPHGHLQRVERRVPADRELGDAAARLGAGHVVVAASPGGEGRRGQRGAGGVCVVSRGGGAQQSGMRFRPTTDAAHHPISEPAELPMNMAADQRGAGGCHESERGRGRGWHAAALPTPART